jgi:transcriptional regulator with XRE-family HTH domain
MYGLNPLRRARQARGLTLQDVATVTKLSPRVLSKIELGEFEALPAGLTGRAHIRAYARAVGLDAEEVLRGLADRLPIAADPLHVLRMRAAERFAEDHPTAAALQARAASVGRRALGLASDATRWRAGLAAPTRVMAAAAVDGLVLSSSGVAMLLASMLLTRSDLRGFWSTARWPLLVSCGLTAVVYGALSHQLGGRTPGAVVVERLARALLMRRRPGAASRWHVWS